MFCPGQRHAHALPRINHMRIKKAALLSLVALTMAAPAWAQVGGGAKVGINLSSISGFNDSTSSSSQRTGIMLGGFMTFDITKVVAFEPEILFSMQGSKLHFSSSGVNSDVTTKVDYVQIPLLVRVGSSAKEHASAYVIAGPTVGLLARANSNGVDVGDSFKKADVGVVAGAGVTLTRVLFEARYTFDLRDLNKVPAPNSSQKNRVISFLLGVVF